MIKTVIIEDEKPASRKLERMLNEFPEIELVGKIESVEEGVQWFSENEHPQLIFSDIVLGDGLSFDIFEKFLQKDLLSIPQLLISTL
jgi:DNA-binding LytR/AlgR family response regulator